MSHHALHIMGARGTGSSWLVPLADLSLILFIITAASLAARPDPGSSDAAEAQPVGSFAQGVPASVFIDLPGGPALEEWLADYHAAGGEQLTIEGYFVPADRATIAARTDQLAQQALAAPDFSASPARTIELSIRPTGPSKNCHAGAPWLSRALKIR